MPLGGELGTNGSKASCTSIAELLGRLLLNGKSFNKVQFDGDEEEEEEQDVAILRGSAVTCLVDIFAILLGVDSPLTSELRSHLGSHTTLLQDTAKQLGLVVDDLTERSFGKKAREVIMLPEEQQFLTGLVRLLGNMCFSCRINQDLMRTTLVPPSLTLKQKTTVVADDDGATTAVNTDPSSRNALHVLLSCTSFTTSCFTLREWSVIAIRNVLEHNTENQELVAALDAQNPIQSAALDGAGVRVNMDSKGKVSLTPLKEGNEEGEGDG